MRTKPIRYTLRTIPRRHVRGTQPWHAVCHPPGWTTGRRPVKRPAPCGTHPIMPRLVMVMGVPNCCAAAEARGAGLGWILVSRSSPADGSTLFRTRRACTSSTLTAARRSSGSPSPLLAVSRQADEIGSISPTRRRPAPHASAVRREASECRYRERPRRRNRRRSSRLDAASRGNLPH